MLVRKIRVL